MATGINFNLTFDCNATLPGRGRIILSNLDNSTYAGDTFKIEVFNLTFSQSVTGIAEGGGYTFDNLLSGDYNVRVHSENQLTYETSLVTLVCCDFSGTTVALTVVDTVCGGSDGKIKVDYTGDLPDVAVSIDGGSNWFNLVNGTYTFTGLAAGDYTVLIRDNNSPSFCQASFPDSVGPDCCISLNIDDKLDDVNTASIGWIKFSADQSGLEFGITGSTESVNDVSSWQTQLWITGLTAGAYKLWARKISDTTCNDSINFAIGNQVCGNYNQLASLFDKTDETGPNLNNGTVTISGSVSLPQLDTNGNKYFPKWFSLTGQMNRAEELYLGINFNFDNLEPGNYTAIVRDAANCTDTVDFVIESGDVPLSGYFEVPFMNSIHFPQNGKFNEKLYIEQVHRGINIPCYQELVGVNDVITLQIRSNFTYNELTLKNLDGSEAQSSIEPLKKVNLIGIEETDNVRIIQADDPSQVEIQFLDDQLPEYAVPGQTIAITGAANGGLNTSFAIVEAGNISDSGLPYVLINFTGFSGPDTATVSATYNLREYDIYEYSFTINQVGKFYILMSGSDPDKGNYSVRSEQLNVTDDLEDTVLIQYSNNDNAWDINYQTGIKHAKRFLGRFFTPTTSGNEDVTRDVNDQLVKKRSVKRIKRQLEVFWISNFDYDKLETIGGHDNVWINGHLVRTEENLNRGDINRYALMNADISYEIIGFFDNFNQHDSDFDVDGGFLQVEESGLLKVRQ